MILLLLNDEVYCKSKTQVYNGQPDIYNQFSFVVCLETTDNSAEPIKFCTGSLIKRNWVITAAHCLVQEKVTVSYGNTISRQLAMTVKVLQQIKHPQHKMINNKEHWTVTNDIGLIEVESIPRINCAKLSRINYKDIKASPVTFAGYGFIWMQRTLDSADITEQIEAIDSTPLLVGQGETIECNLEVVWHPSICVYANTKMRRISDPGGPLIHNGTIIGIFSGSSGNKTVYVPVSLYLNWIHDIYSGKINSNKNNPSLGFSIDLVF